MTTATITAQDVARQAVPAVKMSRLKARDGRTGAVAARASRELTIGGLHVETIGYAMADGEIDTAVHATTDDVTFVSVCSYTATDGIGVTLSNLGGTTAVTGRMSLEMARELRADLDDAIAKAEAKA